MSLYSSPALQHWQRFVKHCSFDCTSALHKLYYNLGSLWKWCHDRVPLIIFHCQTSTFVVTVKQDSVHSHYSKPSTGPGRAALVGGNLSDSVCPFLNNDHQLGLFDSFNCGLWLVQLADKLLNPIVGFFFVFFIFTQIGYRSKHQLIGLFKFFPSSRFPFSWETTRVISPC